MKKILFALEGRTEQLFTLKLLFELIGHGRGLCVELRTLESGRLSAPELRGVLKNIADIHVLLVNCAGDGNVKPFILERKESFKEQKYNAIIGVQDLFPRERKDLDKFITGLNAGLDDDILKIKICIPVSEIEAWFMLDNGFFKKFHEDLTRDLILSESSIDIDQNHIEEKVGHPVSFLNKLISKRNGAKKYSKKCSDTIRYVEQINYELLYDIGKEKSKSWSDFIETIESIMFE